MTLAGWQPSLNRSHGWSFWKVCHTLRPRSRGQNYSTVWKVLLQAIRMCNMKALSILVRKLWLRLKFFKSRSYFKVKVTKSKNLVPCVKSCHKQYTTFCLVSFALYNVCIHQTRLSVFPCCHVCSFVSSALTPKPNTWMIKMFQLLFL